MELEDAVPMRWPCGPLEIEKGKGRASFSASEAETLRAWADPGALDHLAGAPVDCLVVTWAEGSPGDGAHQRALLPLIGAARRRGLSVVGWVAAAADLRRAAGGAQAAGLSAVATESREAVDGFEVLRFRKRGFGGPSSSAFLGDADAVWPGMRPLKREKDVDAVTGATSRPWIDSNGWYVRLARARLAPKTLWLAFDAPDTGQPLSADAYQQAIADTAIAGARWIVSLDPSLRAHLVEGRPQARQTWTWVARSLAFFEAHDAWVGYAPVGQIGVLSDYAGENEFMSFEVLNLLARRSGLYRVLPADRADTARLDGLDSVLCVDSKPPAPALKETLYTFAEAGGTLVTPPGWEARGVPDERAAIPRFRVYRCGRGRLAVAREDFGDPDLVAEDTQLLTSHRRDRVRVFNLGVGQFHYATSTDGRAGVLHTLAFPTPYPRGPIAAWFRQPWARGRVLSVASEAAAKRAAADGGVEFHLPPPPVYAALEVTG